MAELLLVVMHAITDDWKARVDVVNKAVMAIIDARVLMLAVMIPAGSVVAGNQSRVKQSVM
eukprot:scaffold19042_cov76-Cyclotella_meneghiniana.AAC.5